MLPWYENLPFACIFACMLCGILLPVCKKGKTAFRISLCVCAAVSVLFAVLTVILAVRGDGFTYMMGHFPAPWGNELFVGPLEALLCLMFSSVMTLSLLGGRKSADEDVLDPKQKFYYVMLMLLLASMIALSCTNDIFTAYVFIEISTIAACASVMARDTAKTIAATIRYLVISLLGSGLFLIGIVLLYCITGHLLMPQLQAKVLEIAQTGQYTVPLTVVVGLITIGIGIKSAMFPFYAWLPFAHGGATTTSSAVLSGLVLKAYIVLLIRIFYRVFTIDVIRSLKITNIMFVFGIAGMIIGSLLAIREEHIKRMLAYSSIAQIGYIFMGLGLGTDIGMVASIFQMIAHAYTKPMLFLSAGRLCEVQGHEKSLFRLRGAARKDKLAGVCFTIGALSMIGIPLLAGFNAKFYFADAALINERKMWFALIALAISSVLNAMYYVPAVIALWTPSEFMREGKPAPNRGYAVAAVILCAMVLLLGVDGGRIIRLINDGIAVLMR